MAARSATSGGGGGGAAPAHVALSYPLVASVSPHFSLARVASEHVGIMRIRRLLFIAERCPPLSVEAFRLALQELKAAQPQRSFAPSSNPAQLSLPANLGPNPHLYAEVVTRAQALLLQPSNQSEHAWFLSAGAAGRVAQDPLFAPDHAFFQSLQGNLDQAARGLEATLAQQKRDGEREGVKTALLNLAELYQNRGELNHALNKFMEAKEFVTPQSGPQQQAEILHIALSIIRASILSMNLSHVKTQVQRAMRTVKEMQLSGGGGGAQPMALSSPTSGGGGAAAASAAGAAGAGGNNADKNERELNIITSKLHAAHGLFHLKNGAYHSAAQSLTQVLSDLGSSYSDVLSSSDVVTYASLAALASFSRRELKDLTHNNTEFRKMLDTHAPNTWKPLLNNFYTSNYAKVFELLDTLKPDLLLDVFLSPHVNRLVKSIREKAFTQYFTAYVSVSLSAMAQAFNMEVGSLERTLAELIGEGKIVARIDAHKQVLHARHSDARNDTFASAMQLGGRYARDVRALLLRLSLVEHDIAVRTSAAEGKRKAAAAGAGGAGGAAGGAGGAAGGAGGAAVGIAPADFIDMQDMRAGRR